MLSTVVVFSVGLSLLLHFDRPTMAWIIGGMGFGSLAHDLGYLRRYVQLWPATAAMIDRNKLDALIGDQTQDADW